MEDKEKIRLVALFVLGLLLGTVLLEAGLRIYSWAGENTLLGLTPARTTLRFYDNDIFGHAFVPSQEGWFVTESREYYSRVKVNSHGWPDIEHSYQKPEDTFRILLLGDSFVENIQFPLEKRFFRQLETNLNQETEILEGEKGIEVIALARGDTGTAQQYLILKHYGLAYNPDLVVHLFFTGNDVKNSSPTLQTDPYLPYFKINQNGELEKVPHIKRSQRALAKFKEFLKNFRVTELLLSVRQKLLQERTNRASGYPLDYHIYNQKYSREYEEAWEVTKRLIVEAKKAVEAAGAEYILVSLANNEQVHQEIWEKLLVSYPAMQKTNLDLEKPDKILKEFCERESINCLFMLPEFKEYISRHPSLTTHYPLDGHWNRVGTDLAVKFLEENLKAYFSTK